MYVVTRKWVPNVDILDVVCVVGGSLRGRKKMVG